MMASSHRHPAPGSRCAPDCLSPTWPQLNTGQGSKVKGKKTYTRDDIPGCFFCPWGTATSMPMLTLPGLSVTTKQSYNSVTVVDLDKLSCCFECCVTLQIIQTELKPYIVWLIYWTFSIISFCITI